MGLFSSNYDRPGPGIDKDAPPKKGLVLFFDIYFRAFWELIKLNFIFILFCIPIVTIGPACAAMSKVTMLMVRERPFFVFSDFFEAFKKEFKQSFATGLLIGLLSVMLLVGMRFYLQAAAQNPLMYVLWFLFIVMAFMLGMACIYVYPLIVTVSLPLKSIFKNALLLSIICLKHSLPALIAILVIGGGGLLYFPLTIPLFLVFLLSLISFICSFAAWPGMKKYVAGGQAEEQQD
ncbi:DUF624 domain-containing protein [Hydrogenoanaerobacterium sp.]|uniref:YesL family protein n=1 Tax=Hydrogenoanaerobacterium sp. TaxID=2953763 RepID=UPI00289A4833|nr:DUF624 domain-containing protein [Hydrogenoanaerobacterium sp.]